MAVNTVGVVASSSVLVSGVTSPISGGADLLVFLAIGLLGGAHCIGMCGPLVTTYGERMQRDEGWDGALTIHEVRQHALFNVGRTIGYSVLGGLFGLLGALFYGTVTLGGIVGPVQGAMGLVVGSLIVVMGATRLFGYRQGSAEALISGTGVGSIFARTYAVVSGRLDRLVNGTGIVGLGAMHALLPCMLLYPAFLYVFAQGSPLYGLLALGALGVGTIPTVFVYGTLVPSVGPRHRRLLHRALGVCFIGLGYVMVGMGARRFGIGLWLPDIPFYQPLSVVQHITHAIVYTL